MIYAYPCEGVYGLGCDPDSKKDVFKLCELKKRSIDKGLILISGVFEHFEKYINHLDKQQIDKLKGRGLVLTLGLSEQMKMSQNGLKEILI